MKVIPTPTRWAREEAIALSCSRHVERDPRCPRCIASYGDYWIHRRFVFDVLDTNISDTQVRDVAREIVNDESSRDALLDDLIESGYIAGPLWDPTVTPYFIDTSKDNPRVETEALGEHAFCAISRSETRHAIQACSCRLEDDGEWELTMNLDEGVNGSCGCGAVCIDP